MKFNGSPPAHFVNCFVYFIMITPARFTAGNNQLSGEFPEALGQMANLQVLWLFMNQFSGELLQTWSMPALQVLDIYDNQFTGSIPETIAALPNLAQLVIGANRFSGPIPDAIGESMTQLSVLNIEDCMLDGAPIPDSLSNLGNLTILRLGNNANVDSADIPAFVFQDFPNLQELRLPGLKLTGDLTNQTWANLRRLRIVDLSNNDFEGFPDGIVVCRNLEELNLSENNLGGNLPDDIDDLARLKQLFLSNAGLIGNLTESVGNLAALGTSSSSSTRFCVSIFYLLVNMVSLAYFFCARPQSFWTCPIIRCLGRFPILVV